MHWCLHASIFRLRRRRCRYHELVSHGYSNLQPSSASRIGQRCSNYECVTEQSDGSCEAPLNLGNTNATTAPVIETDDRVTIITVGDTTQALHFDTPSCNTLTASPELIFSCVVPECRTYGYDMQLSGYDTVIQLMKVCMLNRVICCDRTAAHQSPN
jgi:hypothetical protein